MTQAKDYNQGRRANTVQYQYDIFNRVTSEKQNLKAVSREYDLNSNLARLTYPSGYASENTYNTLNLLETVAYRGQQIASYQYNQDSRISRVDYANGLSQTRGYNDKSWETSRAYKIGTTTLFSQDTVYDSEGNITREAVNKTNQHLIKEYSYDNLDRITREDTGASLSEWRYDSSGNWSYTTQNGFAEYRQVNLDNEYETITNNPIPHGPNGNITACQDKQYIYDWAGRLIEVKQSGTTLAAYTYDALNRRVSKYTPSHGLTEYYYHKHRVIEEYEGDSRARSFVYASYIDDPILLDTPSGRYCYLKNRQYNVVALADGSGNIIEEYSYTSFGIMSVFDNSGAPLAQSSLGNPYGYQGRRYDPESGLWHYRNRVYSAQLGRFLQRDPSGYRDGYNLYAFEQNNPPALP